MHLSVAFFIGALSAIQGLHFSDIPNNSDHRDPCVASILSCDHYRQSFSLYEEEIGFYTNIEDLKKACNLQTAYMRCMARAEKFCEQRIFLPTAKEMINNRRFPADVCHPPSPWQQLYLREASCLNTHVKKSFDHCVDEEVGIGELKVDNSTLELGCRYVRDIIDCSATILQEKCGYYAGYILKRFFKFHNLSGYKCVDFDVDDVEDNSLISTPNYDTKESILNILEEQISHNEPTERTDSMKNTMEDSFSDSFYYNAKSEDITIEPDNFDFPSLSKMHYIHKNRTNFALYEDSKMGHKKYIGCGEADIFWVTLSPLRSKYCTLMDLKSEYSESVFKCTVHIDAPCSPELDDENENKKAKVFHHRYVVTVLTPNNQLLEYMAVMNVHILKVYTSSYVLEKKINVWIDQANKATIMETESVKRKGHLEKEDDYNKVLYQHGNGSGQKRDTDTVKYANDLDEDEYDESENWDYYPLDEDDDDDIYFTELLNDVIYIEDHDGDLISLHDHRSPIYSNSVYQPYSLFRPRIGVMPASTDSRKEDEDETNMKKKLVQSSIFEETISEFKDETSFPKVNLDLRGYCLAEAPCPSNSETISKFGIKPGMHIDLRTIETFDQFKGLNKKMPRKIQFSRKLNDDIDSEPFVGSREAYVVTPSAEIEFPKSTESRQPEKRYNDVTDHSTCQLGEEDCDNIISTADASRYLDSEYSYTVTSAPDSADSKIDYLESVGENYNYKFTQSPYKYLSKYPGILVNLKSNIDPENSEAESLSEKESVRESLRIIVKYSKFILEFFEAALNDLN